MKCAQCCQHFSTPIALREHRLECDDRPRGLALIERDAADRTHASPLYKRYRDQAGLEVSDAQTDLVSERVANPKIMLPPLANESSSNNTEETPSVAVEWTREELVLFASGEIAEMRCALFAVQQKMLEAKGKTKKALRKKQGIMDMLLAMRMKKRETKLQSSGQRVSVAATVGHAPFAAPAIAKRALLAVAEAAGGTWPRIAETGLQVLETIGDECNKQSRARLATRKPETPKPQYIFGGFSIKIKRVEVGQKCCGINLRFEKEIN